MNTMDFGVNLGFAVKRWPEPQAWANLVAKEMGVHLVQFTFDLIDPWWPAAQRKKLTTEVKQAAQDYGITVHSAFAGLAYYTYNGLLNPAAAGRDVMQEWWRRAIDVTVEVGAEIVGGPLGGLSVADACDPAKARQLHDEQVTAIVQVCEFAQQAGLKQLLIEATPLAREFPHTVEQAQQLHADLAAAAIPVRFVLDVGHALYQPLYGPDANTNVWLQGLGHKIGLIHLQNTDFQSDSHWGWPDERGRFDLSAFARELATAGLTDAPVILEVFYPFEAADADVHANILSSVRYCLAQFGS